MGRGFLTEALAGGSFVSSGFGATGSGDCTGAAAAAPVQSPEPVAPKPEETKEPPAKASVRKPLPKADAARHATHVGEFYENDENDARTRHARGYDPLDKHAQRVEAEVDDAKERRDALYASRVLFFSTRVDACMLLLRRAY